MAAGLAGASLLAAPASAAPLLTYVGGSGRGTTDGDSIRVSVSLRQLFSVRGWLSYDNGHGVLTSTRAASLTVNGPVAKVKGEGRWLGRTVVYYVQIRDRDPKRADTMSVKVKEGKRIVLRQSVALTAGDLDIWSY